MATRKINRSASAQPLPTDKQETVLRVDGREVKLTNLTKPFWPDLGLSKADLLQYYLAVAPWLLPHLRDRAMVMKRYPNGAAGKFFFMKRAPHPRPPWIDTCAIEHASGNVIAFPIVRDLPSLLWIINLGCIDLNPWYARCDDTNRPDYLHFDLDPTPGADFRRVRETALLVRDALQALKMKPLAKTSGSRGIHVYVGIKRGPTQKEVWGFAKKFALALANQAPQLVTAEYRVAQRPARHVLVDYNQNAWGRTLASVYSVRPTPDATVSTPVSFQEIEDGAEIGDFTIFNVPQRLKKKKDLWAPLLQQKGRFDLEQFL